MKEDAKPHQNSKISRWIYVPLKMGVSYAVLMVLAGLIFDMPFTFGQFLYWLVGGTFMGFIIQFLSDQKAKKVSKNKDQKAFDVYQNRVLTLLCNYEKSLALCREAVLNLKSAKITGEDSQNKNIRATVGLNWNTWGEVIEINLKEIGENLTEIEISVSPRLKSMLVSYGRSWKIAEDISEYLKTRDAEINKKVLTDSALILDEIYVKPFQKQTQV